ncbi:MULTISPECIES: TetR/AcrR family transcriptional regulator [Catenuloplanes]|uniref:AcrR family transcriptional regulator n=1 Tax=Catenuloplanes niger TaxID=587534 RepID=A0AAE4CRW8_9ACTN|nr:TetR/AcrR family transcriptional regulator [Catenuloplanes niger]MDR7322420.1 AcrR family transcriptional regulator [Catenuloplanes niger]
MPSTNASKPLTLTEQARRAQLIGVAIETVAAHGYGGTSLARIAEAAGISKAAVLYHFPSKDAVLRAAYASVLESLVAHVGAAVEPHTGAAAVEAYIRALVGYTRLHPDHTRMIIESLVAEVDPPGGPGRHETVAGLVTAAVAAGDYPAGTDVRTTAVIVNGAVDAIVSAGLADPAFDTARAAEQLITMLR